MTTYLTKSVNKPLGGAFAKRYIPIVQVSFHTDTQCYQARGIIDGSSTNLDPTDQLLSVTTTKTLSAPAGTFSVKLAGDGWFMSDETPKLKPNDLVIIYMGYKAANKTVTWVDGTAHAATEDLGTIMIGLIDTVTRTRAGGGNGGQPQVTTTVTGRDFGKLLIKPTLRFYPELNWGTAKEQHFFLTQTGWCAMLEAFTGEKAIIGTPAKILDTIMRSLLKKLVDIKWKVYDDNTLGAVGGPKLASLGNMLRYRFAQTEFTTPFYMTAQQYEGSIWNLMERVNFKPFTELFVDTRDRWDVSWGEDGHDRQVVTEACEESSDSDKGTLSEDKGRWDYPATMFGKKDGAQAVVVYRNTPFTQELWAKLRTHEVLSEDIITETLSYSDNENYNLFWSGTTLTPFASFDLKRLNPPLLNEENALRYGLNTLEVQIEGMQLLKESESTQTVSIVAMAKSLNQKLKDWFEHNDTYLSGSLEVRGKADLRIGQKLIHKDLGLEFYIEGVTQNFQVYGEWHTTVQVTRGRKIT